MGFKPTFEVTRVDSMQWNRTALTFDMPEETTEASAATASLPESVMDQLREAISYESTLVESGSEI
jgi:hypothetical protein